MNIIGQRLKKMLISKLKIWSRIMLGVSSTCIIRRNQIQVQKSLIRIRLWMNKFNWIIFHSTYQHKCGSSTLEESEKANPWWLKISHTKSNKFCPRRRNYCQMNSIHWRAANILWWRMLRLPRCRMLELTGTAISD